VAQTVDNADTHREAGELLSAEFEYKNALRVDEEHIRATFGLGLTYLERGETDSAQLVFRRILSLEAAFGPEQKHLFNAFGIKMRKSGMYPQALRYYFKAYRLAKDDEHLLYNISRTYFERKKYKLAMKFLHMALDKHPGFKVALGLSRVIEQCLAPGEECPPGDNGAKAGGISGFPAVDAGKP
jgi:tetratricopeptide (TPR) repeat protein